MTIQTYPANKSQVTSNFWRYTAVGGETSLSGVDNAGVTLYYYPNQEQVFLNGVLLVRGVDYTATSGTSITGLAVLVAGDTVQVNCYSNFTITQVPVTSLQGSITNAQLANSTITIGGQTINLGGSQNTFSGITLIAPTINNQIAGTGYATSVPLTVKGFSGQSISLQEWQNSSSSVLAKVDQSGNFGIGTTSPDEKLTVQEAGDAQISLKNSSGTTKAYIGTNGAIGSASTDDLRIRSDASNILFGFSGFEKARLTSSGYLGIGTQSPTFPLHVIGNAQLAPTTSSAVGTTYYDVRASGLGDGSPNGVRFGMDASGGAFYGVGYIDTYHGGVAASTPLSLRVEGTERLKLGTDGSVYASGSLRGNTFGYSRRYTSTTGAGYFTIGGSGFLIVHGYIGGNEFWDTVLGQFYGSNTTLASATIGSPPTRTYAMNQTGGFGMQITGGTSGTYTIDVWQFN